MSVYGVRVTCGAATLLLIGACGVPDYRFDESGSSGGSGGTNTSGGGTQSGGTIGSGGAGGAGATGATGGVGASGGTGGAAGASGGTAGAAGSGGTSGAGGAAGAGASGGTSGTGATGATGGAGGTGGSTGGTGGTGGGACPGAMVVAQSSSNAAFCIDTTEVTNQQYASFINSGAVGNTLPGCAWNSSVVPSQGWPPTGKDDHPVVFVDWCDAASYCAWAGKRLCGKVGGGPNPLASGANAASSQWYTACSNKGQLNFCYGNNWSGVCNDFWNHATPQTDPAASNTGCSGGFSGLFDMTGNVWEWEDSCSASTGASNTCLARGGSFNIKATSGERCNNLSSTPTRSTPAADVGFRCCKD